ncbi:MAG: 2-amino-4-hydroxy-6-hydroxymethyldihydropteridine diphosphokinase [Bacteroidia bacterium]
MIFIGLGSNIGDKAAHIREALRLLVLHGVVLRRVASLWQTPPWGVTAQDWFLNTVCEVGYAGEPEALLTCLLDTEREMGRQRVQKWGPRLIDIDLLEFDHQRRMSNFLTLPHPYYTRREFVLAPLAELAPDYLPTGSSQTVGELLAALPEHHARVYRP